MSAITSFLNKLLSVFLLIVSFIVPSYEPVAVLAEVSPDRAAVTIEYTNHIPAEITTTPKFILEKKTENGWEELPFAENAPGWQEIAVILLPGQSSRIAVDVNKYYGAPLEPGEYRAVVFYTLLGEKTATAVFTAE